MQQAGVGPGVVLTGSLSEASPSAGQTPCECVGALRAGRGISWARLAPALSGRAHPCPSPLLGDSKPLLASGRPRARLCTALTMGGSGWRVQQDFTGTLACLGANSASLQDGWYLGFWDIWLSQREHPGRRRGSHVAFSAAGSERGQCHFWPWIQVGWLESNFTS